MKISLNDPNHRLLILFTSLILTSGLWAINGFPNPATHDAIANGIWFMLFGIVGVILFEFLHYDRRHSAHGDLNNGLDNNRTGRSNLYAEKANRALLIWCLSLAYEILVIMFFPAFTTSFGISGSISLPGIVGIVIIIGIPVFFIAMIWSEINYRHAIKSLDPELVENWKPLHRAGGPLFLTGLFLGLYTAFLGFFLGGAIGPVLGPFLPASVSPIFNPLLTGATFALFATPSIIYKIYRRRE